MNEQLRELVAILQKRGFDGRLSKGPPEQIVGGRQTSEAFGFPIYSEPFAVQAENNGWLVRTSGGGQVVNEKVVHSLEDVVIEIENASVK